jgi:solute carrier family 25 protein 33/36
VLRTRLREAPGPDGKCKYTGLLQASRLIYAEEGARGFYRGLLPHIMRVVPNSAIIFLTYELVVAVRARTAFSSSSLGITLPKCSPQIGV